jgi:hypothetical protein
MIFSYVRYEIEPTATIPSGEIYRPRIPVRIIGPKRSVQVFGLLDTGADHVFLSASLAELLGIEASGNVETASGAGGHEIDVWSGLVQIEISQGDETHRWSAHVGFLVGDENPPVAFLGHAGFLEHFMATFDYGDRKVELNAKGDIGSRVELPSAPVAGV